MRGLRGLAVTKPQKYLEDHVVSGCKMVHSAGSVSFSALQVSKCFKCVPVGNWSIPDVEAGESRSGHPCDAEAALSAAHTAARAQPTTEFQSWVAWQLSLQSVTACSPSKVTVRGCSAYETLQDCFGAFHSRES